VGLVPALRELCKELLPSGLAVTFEHENVPPKLPPDLTLCLFRVVQETLQNALKHSCTCEASVSLKCQGGDLVLTIADEGVGFDVAAAWGAGLGLISVRERVAAIDGVLDVQSAPAAGTRYTIVVPAAALDPVADLEREPSAVS
jgi:signal transduction histidine kinase